VLEPQPVRQGGLMRDDAGISGFTMEVGVVDADAETYI
jgi:hypothetical protein